MSEPTSREILEAIRGVEQRLTARIDGLDSKFEDLQDQIVNLSVAFCQGTPTFAQLGDT